MTCKRDKKEPEPWDGWDGWLRKPIHERGRVGI